MKGTMHKLSMKQIEQNWSTLSKLSNCFWCKKFHQFLYGRRFTLITDHKPLLAIFNPKSAIPTLTAPRGCQSFRLQVVSPTSRFAYIKVVSPTRSESIRLQSSRFAYTYTYKSKYFVKMDENHELQLAEESYLTKFPVKFGVLTNSF